MFLKKHLVLVVVVLLSKLLLMTVFGFWLFVAKGAERLPMMTDQRAYLSDIHMISHDLTAVMYSDDDYWSHNTLYSRLCGLIGWVLKTIALPPLYAAMLVNVFSQVVVTYYTTKLYMLADGRHPGVFFVVLNYSPTLSAYSFFALRDLFILAFFSAFMYYVFKKKLAASLFVSCFFLVLRKFFIVFNFIILILAFMLDRLLRSTRKVIPLAAYSMVLLLAIYAALNLLGVKGISDTLTQHNPLYFLAASAGMSRFVAEEGEEMVESTRNVSAEQGKATRIIMFDSITLPILSFFALIVLMKLGTPLQKQMALMAVAIALGLTIGYLGLMGNFPLRKLLSDIPLMYTVVFLAWERLSERRRNKRRSMAALRRAALPQLPEQAALV